MLARRSKPGNRRRAASPDALGARYGRGWLAFLGAWLAVLAGAAHAELDPGHERHRQMLSRSESIPTGDSPDGRCRVCHGHLLEHEPRASSPAGLGAAEAGAWYQRLDTYAGAQATFHWRHRKSPYAEKVMRMQCQTCHAGRDPREPALRKDDPHFPTALRKRVNPTLCLNCHGRFPDHSAAFRGSWTQARGEFAGNCLVCHQADAARRHRSPLLERAAIERLGARSGDVCYGCHGGRAWYAVSAGAIRGAPFDLMSPAPPPPRQTPLTIR